MQVQLNGETTQLKDDLSVTQLIEHLGLAGRRIAVEVNEEIVPRSMHGEARLTDGDRIEVVHAIGGG